MTTAPVNLSLPGEPVPAAPAAQSTPKLPKQPSIPLTLLLITLLTAAGAFIRFWKLGFQSYWTDEAYTIARIHGTFNEMLAQLNDQGFPPGWYALLRAWCLQVERFTGDGAYAFSPASTRLLTAIIGTLTIPAMYYLGRQFFERKTALLVTLFTAVNPFLIYYSRDIKMYACLWLFVILNMAIFFRWQTTHRHWLYLPLYILTGSAMMATQAVAWFIPILQLIFLLTRPRPRWLDAPFWLLGVAIISLLPLYWYTEYVQPARWLNRVSGTVSAGTMWYPDYTSMDWHTGASLATSQLLGYLWPTYPPDAKITNWFSLGADFNQHLATRSSPTLVNWELYAAYALFAVLILGLFPWRGWFKPRSPERAASVTRGRWWWIAIWIFLPSILLALTWIPKDSPWFARVWHGFEVKPMWEPRYLGIILPSLLIWLSASLSRLPTLPVRIVFIAFFAAASIASSLTNHLAYRNVPYGRAAEIAERFTPKDDRLAAVVGVPASYHPMPSEILALTVARHLRPGSPEDLQYSAARMTRPFTTGTVVWQVLADPTTAKNFITINARRPRNSVIVLTDAWADLPPAEDTLSNDKLSTRLGPTWKLVDEESYLFAYEWRPYIFSTWRTRVWQKVSPPPSTAPISIPATRPTPSPATRQPLPATR